MLQNKNASVTSLVKRGQVQKFESEALLKRAFDGSIPAFLAAFLQDNIYKSDRIMALFVLGFIRPRIYLPIGMKNIDYILQH